MLLHIRPDLIEGRFRRRTLRETADSFLYAGVWALLIINVLVRSFYIPSESMLPTLKVGDVLLVNKLIYRFTEPARGDIIVFRPPSDPDRDFIKRVIGVEHDVIEVRDGQVYRNDLLLDEPYLREAKIDRDFPPFRVPPGEVFMMGDNRNNSNDSRFWPSVEAERAPPGVLVEEGSGRAVPLENVVGKATVIFFPPHHIDWLHRD